MLISVFIYSFIMIFIFAFMIRGSDDYQLAAYVMMLTTIIILFVIISNKPWLPNKQWANEQMLLLTSEHEGTYEHPCSKVVSKTE